VLRASRQYLQLAAAIAFALAGPAARAGESFAAIEADAPAPEYKQAGKFPEEKTDADGDGVPDIDDNCPNTPPDPTGKTRPDNCGCPVPVIDPCSLDEDKDGINDCLDQCPHTYAGHKVTPQGCPAPLSQSVRFRLDVKFAFDNAGIASGYEADLLKLRQILQDIPEISISLEGHTDWTGTVAYNQKLSEKRANAARDFILKGTTIDPARVTATGYGKSRPIGSNYSFAGRALNRRTVAEITFDRTVTPANDKPPPLEGLAPENQAPAPEPAMQPPASATPPAPPPPPPATSPPAAPASGDPSGTPPPAR